jgi:hypothetical protein
MSQWFLCRNRTVRFKYTYLGMLGKLYFSVQEIGFVNQISKFKPCFLCFSVTSQNLTVVFVVLYYLLVTPKFSSE